ncbi:MAG: D-serine ammonia-lyase [Oscillospiraceae bacterium]|nr:D-serine ammonia-lyase [Oscillospiraceae bacterium]
MELSDYARALAAGDEALGDVAARRETFWLNKKYLSLDLIKGVCSLTVSQEDIADAAARLERFRPFIQARFPETEETGGLIESPLRPIPAMQAALGDAWGCSIPGRLCLKMDSHLAVAGSVKARGGIYEVLKHGETLALAAGKLRLTDDYARLAGDDMRDFFHQYTIQVGSTGNLGLSIGISGAALGFQVKVHMSADAKQWKKDLLRAHGVQVLEYRDDYSRAVAEGRKASDADPNSYFVDDERSKDLFLGYAVAAGRLEAQLRQQNIPVDEEHPLLVYIPAGVGGAPGGVTYGLKQVFGDNVHCFFTEPVLCPSVLLGFATGRYENANVHDFGLSGQTDADGLACASPSGFVTRLDENLVSGCFTVQDGRLYDFMRLLHRAEDILIEPSSCAAFIGPAALENWPRCRQYREAHGLTDRVMAQCTQICWATGGSLVPDEIWAQYLSHC